MANDVRPRPTVLYHYCSIHGFKGIIENKCLWLNQLSSMNDYMEHSWLRKLAMERLAELQNGYRWSLLDPPAKAVPFRFYSALQLQLEKVAHIDPYCVCFSQNGDVLSQWRAYADDGRGFAVGFDSASLVFPHKTELREVCYDENEQRTIVKELIEEFRNRLTDTASQWDMTQRAHEFHTRLLGPSITCKNPKFSEEQEWRVIYEPGLVDDPLGGNPARADALSGNFRVRAADLLHYFVLPFNDEFVQRSVVEVVLGPKNPARLNRDALDMFLKAHGYGDTTMKDSDATYR